MSDFDTLRQATPSKSDMASRVQIRHAVDMATKDDLPNRIRELRERLGLSMAQLGVRIGVEGSTINKLEKGETQLTTRWMTRLAPALEIDDPVEIIRPISNLRTVSVVGYVQAGQWREAITWDDEERYGVIVPRDKHLDGVRLEGYEVRGPSMNKIYPEGTVVIIASIIDTEEAFIPGKRYVINRQRGDEVEGTVKTYHVDESGRRWLTPESTMMEFQPISLDDGHNEDTEIRALGRVMYSVRRE
ncbi:LexA family transcriptional regulator [Ancylobacter sp. FA202]|uniref:LexA family protein n=1 Tax=Ancylobacter sp. FA202 TaxID=1111106 RepID=UPI0003728CC1|nr:LexA family transcriptional regulator [Ancylobacter sp. FA202]